MANLTLEHYNQRAEEFWAGTRDHDVSQNIAAMLHYIAGETRFTVVDFGCGPGRDLKVVAEMAHAYSGCEVWQQDFLKLYLPDNYFDGVFANAALFLAYQMGETKPLRDFVKAGKSVPQAHVFVAGESIPMRVLVADLLGDHHQQQEQRSRPHRVASEAPPAAQAERNAAWLVAFARKGWLKRNGRTRVPGVVTNEMIKVAIEEAAKTFKVPVSAIYESNIRNLLKKPPGRCAH